MAEEKKQAVPDLVEGVNRVYQLIEEAEKAPMFSKPVAMTAVAYRMVNVMCDMAKRIQKLERDNAQS